MINFMFNKSLDITFHCEIILIMKTLAIGALLITCIASKKYLVEVDDDKTAEPANEGSDNVGAVPDGQEAGSDYGNNFWDYGPPSRAPTSPPAYCEEEIAKCAKVLVTGCSNPELNGEYELLPTRKGPSKKPQYRHVDKKGLIFWKTHFHRYEIRPLPLRFREVVSKTGWYLII